MNEIDVVTQVRSPSITEVPVMRRSRLAVAAVLLLVGVIWIGQGTGAVAGSAMSGQSMWAFVGVVLVVGGLVIGLREFLRKPAGRP
jgi:hypothetical protein